jgi:hypothetical protein
VKFTHSYLKKIDMRTIHWIYTLSTLHIQNCIYTAYTTYLLLPGIYTAYTLVYTLHIHLYIHCIYTCIHTLVSMIVYTLHILYLHCINPYTLWLYIYPIYSAYKAYNAYIHRIYDSIYTRRCISQTLHKKSDTRETPFPHTIAGTQRNLFNGHGIKCIYTNWRTTEP